MKAPALIPYPKQLTLHEGSVPADSPVTEQINLALGREQFQLH